MGDRLAYLDGLNELESQNEEGRKQMNLLVEQVNDAVRNEVVQQSAPNFTISRRAHDVSSSS